MAAFAIICFHYTPATAVRYISERRNVTAVDGDNAFILRCLAKELEVAWAEAQQKVARRSSSAAPAALADDLCPEQRQWRT
eukprot:4263837-Alexandrium_andersonii.AAC.1